MSTVRVGHLLEPFDRRLGRDAEPEVLTLTEKNGFVSQSERFHKRLATENTSRYKLIAIHDIAFNPYLLWAGAIAQNVDWDRAVISPLYPTFHVRAGYDPRYVARLLHTGEMLSRYDSIAFGSVPRRRRSSVRDLMDLAIPAPPSLEEQQRIAQVLDRADALRTKRLVAIAHLDDLSQSIFFDMFGDGSWRSRPFRDLVAEFRYGTSNKSEADGLPALRIPNVIGGRLDLREVKLVPVRPEEFERLRLVAGDMLFVRSNGNPDAVGRCAVFDPDEASLTGFAGDSFIYASYLIRARVDDDVAVPAFIREFMLGAGGRAQLRSRCKTSAGQYNINIEGIGSIDLPIPPMGLQREFAQRVAVVQAAKRTHRAHLAELDTLFASLQSRAFNGEL
jgi:type I restriction enzyme S subunit